MVGAVEIGEWVGFAQIRELVGTVEIKKDGWDC